MRTNYAFIFLLLAVFTGSCEENRAPAGRNLSPELLQDTVDLGEISDLLDTSFSIMIFNPASKPIVITARAKSCGCTRLDISKDTIPARGHVTARIGFNSSNLSGHVTKSVFFRYSTGEISILRILADIKPI